MEKLIHTTINVLAKLAKEQKAWDQYLLKVLVLLTASVHETTGFSPGILMFGRELNFLSDPLRNESPVLQSADYPSCFAGQCKVLRDVAELSKEN